MGASMLTSCQGTMPVSTPATEMYRSGADHQRDDDADGQVALRILGFLRGGGNGVEADVGEENVGRAGADAAEAMGAKLCQSCPSLRVDMYSDAEADHEEHHGDLDDHDGGVEAGAFLDADAPG